MIKIRTCFVALLMMFCIATMGIVVLFPNASAVDVAINIKTHHREGDSDPYNHPSDNYFREEYDDNDNIKGWDNVYFSFLATRDGEAYDGNLWVTIDHVDSGSNVYNDQIFSNELEEGFYYSYKHGEFWEIEQTDAIGEYRLEISNGVETIGMHSFWVYEPSTWTATIETYEDSARTIPTTNFPQGTNVYYKVTVVDEHDKPLYYAYDDEWIWDDDEYFDAHRVEVYLEYDSIKELKTTLDLYDGSNDIYGEDYGSFTLSESIYEPGEYVLKVEHPSGTELANSKSFNVYKPSYTATIKTYTDASHDTETSIYQTNARVYWKAHIEDQHGRDFSGDSVYAQVEHGTYGTRQVGSDYISDWENGNASGSFDLHDHWPYEEDQIGLYTLRISDSSSGDPFTGSADFEVINIKISPERDPLKYAQGEEIMITVSTKIYEEDIDVYIYNEEGSVVTKWEDESLSNKIWTKTYTFTETLPDGQYILSVNNSATGRAIGTLDFAVQKYTLKIWPDSDAYLPGEKVIVYYMVTSNKDGSGVSGTTIEWKFKYFNYKEDEYETIPGSFSGSASGSFDLTIPKVADKEKDGRLYVWVNDTSEHTAYKFESIQIGGIEIDYMNPDSNEYLSGDFVRIDFSASIDKYAPLRDGNVAFRLFRGDSELTSYTKTNLKTDESGDLEYIFTLDETLDLGTYTILMNVSKSGTNEYAEEEREIELVETRSMSMVVGLDKPQYYSGNTVTVSYQVFREGAVVSPINAEYDVESDDNVIAVGTDSTGTFTFNIPEDFDGSLTLRLKATDSDGESIEKTYSIYVRRAGFMLQTNKNRYQPGDEIKVDYEAVGNIPTNPQYYYRITDGFGVLVRKESLTSGSGEITFSIPEGNVPSSYTFTCYLADENGNNIASDSVTVSKLSGYMIVFTLDKETYKPGETATLRYEIISLSGSPIPDEFTLKYGYAGGQEKELTTTDPKGKLTVDVPDDAPDGTGYFYINSPNLGVSQTNQEANIRSNPNPLADTAFADISNFELILLLLLILCIILAIIGLRRSKRALKESQLPPWKKEQPLPEPEEIKSEPEEFPPSIPPEQETMPPTQEGTPPPAQGGAPPPPLD